MIRYIALALLCSIAACRQGDICQRACDVHGVKSYDDQHCVCRDPTPPVVVPYNIDAHLDNTGLNAKAFCMTCASNCAGGVKRCAYADSTWGAGPNVCECYPTADGGAK